MSGQPATGDGLAPPTCGCRAPGSSAHDQAQFGSPAIGCRVPAAGHGFQATEHLALVLHQPRILAKISGATIVASDSIMNRGVSTLNFPHVIFSLGTAPEYEPKLVVESLIWQKKPHSGTGVLTTS